MADSIFDVNEILNDYSSDIQDAIIEEAQKIAKDGASELKSTSPKTTRNLKHKGRYAKGWRVKTTKGRYFINCVVYNATDYQLTHLLEKPHLTKKGNLTKPIVHIAPVEEKINKEFQTRVENIIRNGGK